MNSSLNISAEIDVINLARLRVKNKIQILIDTKYHSLDKFIEENPDFNTFREKHEKGSLETTIRRAFGKYEINEDIYKSIIEELRELEDMLRIETEKITTVSVNGKEIATYHGEDGPIMIDNTYAGKPVEEQLPELQEKYARFREEGSTKDMVEFLRDEIKPDIPATEMEDIPKHSLTNEEHKIAEVAEMYKENADEPVQVDFENKLIIEGSQVHSIEERDGEIGIYASEEIEQSHEKGPQKVLKKPELKQAGFSSSIALALLSGVVMGLAFLNFYLGLI